MIKNDININIKNSYEGKARKIGLNIQKCYSEIKSIEEINQIVSSCKGSLDLIKKLNIDYKLSDYDYRNFIISMGKFSLAIDKCEKLNISHDKENEYLNLLIEYHEEFREIEDLNCMKDIEDWS